MPRVKEEMEEGAPAWILSYADLTQQLLCMFILFFSMMKLDDAKARAVLEIFNPKIQEIKGDLNSTFSAEKVEIFTTGATIPMPQEGLELLVLKVSEGVKITIEGNYFFEEGRADLPEEVAAAVDKISDDFIGTYLNSIDVRGYTAANTEDSVSGDQIYLSYLRARAVGDRIVANQNVTNASERVRMTACGPNAPVADNQDAKKRAKNRRVEIIVTEQLIKPK